MQKGKTPLHYAASGGDSSTAKALLEAGADAGARDNVSSCVIIGRDLSKICYSVYGSIRFALQNCLCHMLVLCTVSGFHDWHSM